MEDKLQPLNVAFRLAGFAFDAASIKCLYKIMLLIEKKGGGATMDEILKIEQEMILDKGKKENENKKSK